MIDVDNWLRELAEEDDRDIKNNEEYQAKLFEEYVLRGKNFPEKRRELLSRYRKGEDLLGTHGLRKELAAFDLSYFGRAYLPHYFFRQSPHFHEELDDIWTSGVLKGIDPAEDQKRSTGKRAAGRLRQRPVVMQSRPTSHLRMTYTPSCTSISITY